MFPRHSVLYCKKNLFLKLCCNNYVTSSKNGICFFFIGNITVEVMNHGCLLLWFFFKDPMTCECVSGASIYRKKDLVCWWAVCSHCHKPSDLHTLLFIT